MITGAHVILYSENAEADRAFFRDVLKFPWVDAGRGWLIFALPPSELAAHPATTGEAGGGESGGGAGKHELYLMCTDVHAAVAELSAKGVKVTKPVSDQGWGLVTSFRLPGGSELSLYQPRHPLPTR